MNITKTAKTRMKIDGLYQYTGIIKSKENYPLDATTEYVDWFADDAAAEAGYRELLEGQGFTVLSVEIGFPCVVTIE